MSHIFHAIFKSFRILLAAVLCWQWSVTSAPAQTQPSLIKIPSAGLSDVYRPAVLKGMTVDPVDPFTFDFLLDAGDDPRDEQSLRQSSSELIRYFLASFSIPEEHMWVNLSPYEPDRIIPQDFGQTQMGQELLALDYLLKQLSSSLMNPDDETGQEFWEKIYQRAMEEYGTTDIPMNTFNKIWIVPEKASVSVIGQTVYISGARLKVMLEEDYVALQKTLGESDFGLEGRTDDNKFAVSGVTADVVRNILIPAVEQEVNEGRTFAKLRQIYSSMILASWYKQNLKDSFLSRLFADSGIVAGVEAADPHQHEAVYQKYVEAFRNGAFDLIREDYDPASQQVIPRKYFSGGLDMAMDVATEDDAALNIEDDLYRVNAVVADAAMIGESIEERKSWTLWSWFTKDDAMLSKKQETSLLIKILTLGMYDIFKATREQQVDDLVGNPTSEPEFGNKIRWDRVLFVSFLAFVGFILFYSSRRDAGVDQDIIHQAETPDGDYPSSATVSGSPDSLISYGHSIESMSSMRKMLEQQLSDRSYVYYAHRLGRGETPFHFRDVNYVSQYQQILKGLARDGFSLASGDEVLLVGPENEVDGRVDFREIRAFLEIFPDVGVIHIATIGRIPRDQREAKSIKQQYQQALEDLESFLKENSLRTKVVFHDANVLALPFKGGQFKFVGMNEVVIPQSFDGSLISDAYDQIRKVLEGDGVLVASFLEQFHPESFGFDLKEGSSYGGVFKARQRNPIPYDLLFREKALQVIMTHLGGAVDLRSDRGEWLIDNYLYLKYTDEELLGVIKDIRAGKDVNDVFDGFYDLSVRVNDRAMMVEDPEALGNRTTGGINLNSRMLKLETAGGSLQMTIPVGDPALLKQKISAFQPVIRSIVPLKQAR